MLPTIALAIILAFPKHPWLFFLLDCKQLPNCLLLAYVKRGLGFNFGSNLCAFHPIQGTFARFSSSLEFPQHISGGCSSLRVLQDQTPKMVLFSHRPLSLSPCFSPHSDSFFSWANTGDSQKQESTAILVPRYLEHDQDLSNEWDSVANLHKSRCTFHDSFIKNLIDFVDRRVH